MTDVASEADLAAFVTKNAVGETVVVAGRFVAGSPEQKLFAAAADDADMESFKCVRGRACVRVMRALIRFVQVRAGAWQRRSH